MICFCGLTFLLLLWSRWTSSRGSTMRRTSSMWCAQTRWQLGHLNSPWSSVARCRRVSWAFITLSTWTTMENQGKEDFSWKIISYTCICQVKTCSTVYEWVKLLVYVFSCGIHRIVVWGVIFEKLLRYSWPSNKIKVLMCITGVLPPPSSNQPMPVEPFHALMSQGSSPPTALQ